MAGASVPIVSPRMGRWGPVPAGWKGHSTAACPPRAPCTPWLRSARCPPPRTHLPPTPASCKSSRISPQKHFCTPQDFTAAQPSSRRGPPSDKPPSTLQTCHDFRPGAFLQSPLGVWGGTRVQMGPSSPPRTGTQDEQPGTGDNFIESNGVRQTTEKRHAGWCGQRGQQELTWCRAGFVFCPS